MIGMKKDYYVYIHYRKSNPLEPFYVGKGRGQRAWTSKNRNDWWHNIVNKDGGFRCEIVYRGLSEAEALAKEIFIVALYGRKDLGTGTLVNLTDGGEGGSNPSEETRRKISEAARKQIWRPPSEEHRKKISEALMGRKCKPHSEEHRKKISEAAKRQWENKRLNGN